MYYYSHIRVYPHSIMLHFTQQSHTLTASSYTPHTTEPYPHSIMLHFTQQSHTLTASRYTPHTAKPFPHSVILHSTKTHTFPHTLVCYNSQHLTHSRMNMASTVRVMTGLFQRKEETLHTCMQLSRPAENNTAHKSATSSESNASTVKPAQRSSSTKS